MSQGGALRKITETRNSVTQRTLIFGTRVKLGGRSAVSPNLTLTASLVSKSNFRSGNPPSVASLFFTRPRVFRSFKKLKKDKISTNVLCLRAMSWMREVWGGVKTIYRFLFSETFNDLRVSSRRALRVSSLTRLLNPLKLSPSCKPKIST